MRLVQEARREDPELSPNAAVVRIGSRVGVNADTLRGWCKQADIDAGKRPGTTTDEAQRIKQLEAEVRELKRSNAGAGPQVRPVAGQHSAQDRGGGLQRFCTHGRTARTGRSGKFDRRAARAEVAAGPE